MSQQRFSLQFREALWDVHDHRCIYCTTSLLFMEMEIDHVVPEQLLSDPPILAKLKLEMGLASSFDVLGYENLAPSCRDCNGKKHGRPFPAGYGSIVLGKVAEKLPELRAAIDRKRQDRDLDSTLRHIAWSLDKGLFSPEDLLKGIEILRKLPNGISGSSPNAPPASPELREANIRFNGAGRLRWTPEAMAAMSENGYTADRINDMIHRAVMNGSLMAKQIRVDGPPTYMVRVAADLRVVFAIMEDTALVISVYQKRSI